ncbi:hypothetical protein GGR16_002631 [Chelatococcus caeni]|uniref:Uncharacterized protein n=1 Tax=Chelatococcus caeni TaxID=1348468 RepID=A0A840C5C1_9HYPH|nr:hypothetical protein [Chelatococcus caeni]MBB4017597.1 hypothetical protein [Chelatococcus caeni]
MPKFKVQLQQYVEQVAEIEVEAPDHEEARRLALLRAESAEWQPGDDAYSADAYSVLDEHGRLVWER